MAILTYGHKEKYLTMTTENKTFCPLFFKHVALWNGTTARPCCRYDPDANLKKRGFSKVPSDFKFTNFDNTFHSTTWKILREESLRGIEDPGCWKCYEEEENGIESLRLSQINANDFDLENPELSFLEINLGNHCNLACNICCSDNSDKWLNDDIALKALGHHRAIFKMDNHYGFSLNKDDYKNVTIIKFVGGEPMLHPKFISVLDFLIESNFSENISLQIFTNCSWVPKDKVLNRLAKFKSVLMSLSVDGMGSVQEYSRWGSEWDIVQESVTTWLNTSERSDGKISVRIEPTVNIYNALYMDKLLKWWMNLCENLLSDGIYCKEDNSCNIIFNPVSWPHYLSPHIIPTETKLRATQKIKTLREKFASSYTHEKLSVIRYDFLNKMEILISSIEKEIPDETRDDLLDRFVKFSYDLDKQRNTSVYEYLPDLMSCFDEKYEYKSLQS